VRGGILANPIGLRFLLSTEFGESMSLQEIQFSDLYDAFVSFVAGRIATIHRQSIFTTADKHYSMWWKNLVAQLKIADRIGNTIFVSEDLTTCEPLWEAEIMCIENLDGRIATIRKSGADLGFYGVPVLTKHFFMHRLLKLGYDVLFLDGDVAILRDPMTLFRDDLDMMGLSDHLETKVPCHNHHFGTCQSTGVMMVTHNSRTLTFFRNMTEALYSTPHIWEQELFNQILPRFVPNELRYDYFPIEQVSNCRVFRDYALRVGLERAKKEMVILHLGWVQREHKELMFSKYGIFLGSKNVNDSRVSGVEQGIDLLLPGRDAHPFELCQPNGIWSYP